jgi:acetylornithine deacetylase/succinyl-diaminopimelate desuccinylase-like protein
MPTLSPRASEDSIARLAQDSRCAQALAWFESNADWVTNEQIRLTEIPAPEFGEAARGSYLAGLFEDAGLAVRTDEVGNVIAERPGADIHSVILLAAHLDTVFPTNTRIRVKRAGGRIEAPGITDNGAGLAALAAVARALSHSGVRTAKSIVLAGDVGEEGEGNLRGIRALVESYGKRLVAVIAVDGPSTDHVTTQAVASRRFEISVSGPGGHSWSDFGAPNPITAISRGIVRFSAVRVPSDPRTSYNFGVIEGGTSVNSMPARASVKVDLRSESDAELNRLEKILRDAMAIAAKDEIAASSQVASRPSGGATHLGQMNLHLEIKSLGQRPAGKLPDNSPLLEAVRNVDRFLGNRSRLERGSTDANIPLSLGIPALSVGGGGKGGGAHTLDEWYEPAGRELGLKRVFLLAIALAGLQT